MNAILKQLSYLPILQIGLIADSLIIHIEVYFNNDIKYLCWALTLIIFHLFVLVLETKCVKNQKSRLICNIVKVIMIVGVNYQLNPEWLVFAGMQLVLIIQLENQNIKLQLIFLIPIHVTCICLMNTARNNLLVELLRTLNVYLLITCILNQEKIIEFDPQLINAILTTLNHDEFCLLDDQMIPLLGQTQFATWCKLIVRVPQELNFQSTSRIVSPRDSQAGLNQLENQKIGEGSYMDEIIKLILNKKLSDPVVHLHSDNDIHFTLSKISQNKSCNFFIIVKMSTPQCPKNSQIAVMQKTLQKVSHDMRNPLNAIINMQMCLRDHIDIQLSSKYLKPSLNSCHLLLNLINDILDAAQVENTKLRLVYKKFNLDKLIMKTISLFDSIIEKKELNVSYNYDHRLCYKVSSDKLRIRQIIMNLLSNAIKYTQPKGQIMVDCCMPFEGSDCIEISVQDSGMGIKPENLKLLFNEFSKVEDEANRKANPMGIGLGLAISHELAKLLGQNKNIGLQVQSESGKGSKFYFQILNQQGAPEDLTSESVIILSPQNAVPVFEKRFIEQIMAPTVSLAIPSGESSNRIAHNNSKSKRPSSFSVSYQLSQRGKIESEKLLSKKTLSHTRSIRQIITKWNDATQTNPPVLIVDDNEINILVLQYLLEQLGIESDSAMSGINAVQKFGERLQQNQPYQLVFMDIEMPVMDGFETTQKLLKLDSSIIIIACTGHKISNTELEQYKSTGMMHAVEKPVNKAQLKEIMLKFQSEISQESVQFSYQ